MNHSLTGTCANLGQWTIEPEILIQITPTKITSGDSPRARKKLWLRSMDIDSSNRSRSFPGWFKARVCDSMHLDFGARNSGCADF